MKFPIYLDYHATTPMDPEVLEVMLPFMKEDFGNPASSHAFGWKANDAVEAARKQVAELIGARANEIIFTSGATESNNFCIKGIARANKNKGKHIITTKIEHPSVLSPCLELENEGFDITYLPVSKEGLIDLDSVKEAMREDTILVSIMFANNEIGTINPIQEIGELCRSNNILFHTDATQAVGYLPVDVEKMNIHLLSMSGHKIYGPKGAGALYIKSLNPKIEIKAHAHGGGQERNLRSGTLNVPAIVGLGKASEICLQKKETEFLRLKNLRDKLCIGLQKNIKGLKINASMENRLPQNLNFCLQGGDAESFLLEKKEICASSGSACLSQGKGSHVLKALGLSDESIYGSIRLSLGRFTTEEQVNYLIQYLSI